MPFGTGVPLYLPAWQAQGEHRIPFKSDVAEVIVESLRPIREQYNDLLKNKDYLEKVYAMGADKAERHARKTLRKVYKKVGLIERKFL